MDAWNSRNYENEEKEKNLLRTKRPYHFSLLAFLSEWVSRMNKRGK